MIDRLSKILKVYFNLHFVSGSNKINLNKFYQNEKSIFSL